MSFMQKFLIKRFQGLFLMKQILQQRKLPWKHQIKVSDQLRVRYLFKKHSQQSVSIHKYWQQLSNSYQICYFFRAVVIGTISICSLQQSIFRILSAYCNSISWMLQRSFAFQDSSVSIYFYKLFLFADSDELFMRTSQLYWHSYCSFFNTIQKSKYSENGLNYEQNHYGEYQASPLQQLIPKLQQILHMKSLIVILLVALCTYSAIPQLQAGLSVEIINRQLADTLGPLIIDEIMKYNITQNFSENTTVDGVKVEVNLSKLKIDRLEIKWTDNVLEPVSEYNFTFFGRNINATVEAFVDGKISLKKIKTTAIVTITQMDMNVSMGILPQTSSTGAGFNLRIFHIELDIKNIDVKFVNDTIDTTIVQLIIKIIKSSLPNIINKAVQEQINPKIQQLLSNRVFLDQKIGKYMYSFDLNTTTLPMFYNKNYLSVPIDIIINNLNTKAINPEIQNDRLPTKVFAGLHEAELIVSSGFIYSLIWLVEDSDVINVVVDNSMLPPGQSPVELTTTGLAILLPELPGKYGADKGMYIEVTTSTKTPEMYIRQGRFIVSLSVNLNFIVDNTKNYPHNNNVAKCMADGLCSNATTLNTSVLVSAALKTDTRNNVFGAVQLVKIEDLQTYASSEIDVNTKSLKMILNTLVGTFVAPINLLLRDGYPIPMAILKGLNITNIQIKTELDYMATGLTFELS